MSNRVPQPAENFDSTAKLMLEALAKASAELEKSVTAFTEQLISFNEGLQKSLDEELREVNFRLEGCIKENLDELAHNKHLMVKRLLEAERAEVDSLSHAGREVRKALSQHALRIEERIEEFMQEQIEALKEYLKEPESQVKSLTERQIKNIEEVKEEGAAEIHRRQDEIRKVLTDKVENLEKLVKDETSRARDIISAASDQCQHRLNAQRESIAAEIGKFTGESLNEINERADHGNASLKTAEEREKAALREVGDKWKQQINKHCDQFNKLLSSLSAVVKENYETELANASQQARQEITELSSQAHEKISTTRSELEIELRELEGEFIHQFEDSLRKLEHIVNEYADDKKNSGLARHHKAQKLRDQMHAHLKRWGAELVDSIKDATQAFESDFTRATEGFQSRIEVAKASAIELLERETRLLQKDVERTMREFEKDVAELEGQLTQIEKAGQDAALTVIACRKAVLSFRGE